jgi:hypothetical protein
LVEEKSSDGDGEGETGGEEAPGGRITRDARRPAEVGIAGYR